MGGFIIDTDDNGEEPYISGSPQLFLTARGVLFIAEKGGEIPDISKDSILDRSKADNLAKGLVCMQASWIIIQCLGRVFYHLPLTLLEINTLGHVICAFAMYGFWLKKPLDVRDTIAVHGNWIRPLCVYMWMYSEPSQRELSKLQFFMPPEMVEGTTSWSLRNLGLTSPQDRKRITRSQKQPLRTIQQVRHEPT